MPQPAADRNLLFGILAMQMDFISREQLIAAMQAWVFDKAKSLGEILQAQKALAEDNRALLDALVRKHLVQHGNDVEKSLAAVSSMGNVRTDLEKIADADVQASLVHVPARAADPYATIAPSPSTARPTTGMRFRIIRPHAKGGLGEVFVARDDELNREVALKEIQDRQADDPESRSRFMLEAEITGGLEHPGIVPVYGLGAYADGRPYYAMRFIRGDSLKDAIERFHNADQSSMSAGQRTLILRGLLGRLVDVCNAIAYAHARGVLHRDLKPGNIMLGKYGETLVVDWGLAKPLGEPAKGSLSTEPGEGSLVPSSLSSATATMVGAAVGTPQYMSPEQAAGRLDQLGPASDVYSLGATLFCILTGKAPISESDVGTMLRKVQQGDLPRPRQVKGDVPAALEAVCLKAMALKPADRYPSPRDLADDIEHWLADEPVTAWQEPLTTRARRWIGRNATLVTSAASALLVALVGLIVAAVLLTAANERERAAKEYAQEQEKEVRKQKEKVEQNYQLARQAVDRYHTAVSESRLLHEPGLQPLRKELLEAAAEYFAKFRMDRAGDPTVQGELGKATFRLAQITADIDSKPNAIRLHEQAARLFETLPTDQANADYQSDLAACYHHLGRLHRQIRKTDKAEEFYAKAIGAWERLLKENAKDANYLAGMARSQLGLGNVYQDKREFLDAEKIYQAALDTRKSLAAANPKVAEYQRDLAISHNNRAVLFMDIRKDVAGEYQAALKIQKQLAGEHPHISQYQDDLARTHFNLSDRQTQTGPAYNDEAAGFEEAARIWKALTQRHPAHSDYHKMLAETYARIARAYRETPNAKKADEAALQAVATQRKLVSLHKDDPSYEGNLAGGLFALGEVSRSHKHSKQAEISYQEAIKILDKLFAASPSLRGQQARAYNGLGLLYYQEKKTDQASAAYDAAKKIWEKLVADHPNDSNFVLGLSTTLCNLGNLAQVRKPMDAQLYYTQALASLDAKQLKTPAGPSVKLALRDAHMGRAKALTALMNYTDALADWDRAIELTRKDERKLLQLPRAAALALAGKHVEATKEAALLVAQARDAVDRYSYACVYSFAVAAVEADTKLPAPERQKLAAEYTAAAVQLLSDAREAGLFKSSDYRKRLDVDPDLEAVRSCPEFKNFLNALKAP